MLATAAAAACWWWFLELSKCIHKPNYFSLCSSSLYLADLKRATSWSLNNIFSKVWILYFLDWVTHYCGQLLHNILKPFFHLLLPKRMAWYLKYSHSKSLRFDIILILCLLKIFFWKRSYSTFTKNAQLRVNKNGKIHMVIYLIKMDYITRQHLCQKDSFMFLYTNSAFDIVDV